MFSSVAQQLHFHGRIHNGQHRREQASFMHRGWIRQRATAYIQLLLCSNGRISTRIPITRDVDLMRADLNFPQVSLLLIASIKSLFLLQIVNSGTHSWDEAEWMNCFYCLIGGKSGHVAHISKSYNNSTSYSTS